MTGSDNQTFKASSDVTTIPTCPASELRQSGHVFSQPVLEGRRVGRLARRSARVYLPRGNPEIPESPRCVVVTTGGNLGGAILSLPLITSIRNRFPDAHLAVVSNTRVGREFMRFSGVGDSFWAIPAGATSSLSGLRSYGATIAGILAKRPALLVSNHDCGIDDRLVPLRVPVRVGHTGHNPGGRPVPWSSAHNVPVPITADLNWLETYRMLAERVGAEFPGPPSVDVPEPLRSWADEKLSSLGLEAGEKCAAVQIGVWQVQAWKEWPVSHLAEVCRSLWNQHKVRPVLMGDSGGAGAAAELQRLIPEVPAISLVGATSVSEAAAIIDRCDVTICNDSGLMHLSAAVGTPTVAVYGMTNPAKTWCYDLPHRFVRRTDTLPCYDLDTRVLESCPHRMCLTQLEPELVLSAVLDALAAS